MAKKATKKAATKKKTEPKKARKPRQRALPTMEQARNEQMMAICESVAKHRRNKNKAANGEGKDLDEAVVVMERDNIPFYKYAGVALTYKEGKKTVSVRELKESQKDADAEPEPDDTTGQE